MQGWRDIKSDQPTAISCEKIIYLQPLWSSIHLLLSPLKLTSSPSVVQRTPASQSFCNRKHAGEDREPGDTDCDYWLKEVDNKVQYFDNENKKCRAITNMRVQPCNQWSYKAGSDLSTVSNSPITEIYAMCFRASKQKLPRRTSCW